MNTTLTISDEQARRLTDRIKIALDGTWHLIVEAYESRAWSVLGYQSWDSYCTAEFSSTRLKLPREERSEQIRSLREQGLSIRAIASATGNSDQTVQKDLRSPGVVNHYTSPAPAPRVSNATSAPSAPSPAPAPSAVIGMDGKTYQRPEPRPTPERPRRSMAENLDDALSGLNLVLSMGDIHADLTPKQQALLISKLESIITRVKGEQS